MARPERWAKTRFTGDPSGGNVLVTLPSLGVELPVSQFTMTYGVNSIPTASAVVALGRDARTGDQSAVYDVIDDLKQMTEVVVTLEGDLGEYSTEGVAGGGKTPWPAGRHVLFIGYISGTSYRRSLGSVSLVVNFIQKLFDLTQSSAGAADLVPGSPNSLLMPALHKGSGGEVNGLPGSRFVTELKNDMTIDFSEGLLKCLVDLCKNSELQTHGDTYCQGISPPGGLSDPATNERALGALEADGGDWLGVKNLDGPSAYTTAYPFNLEDTQRQHATTQIGVTMFQSLAGTSMWSMMIGSILPDFGMGFVPIANQAFLVPLLPVLKTTATTKKISVTEIADFQMTTASQRPLYGVGILGNYSNGTLANSVNKQCVGAYFSVSAPAGDPAAEGMWMFQPAPRWMDDWVSTDPAPPAPVGVGGGGGRAIENMLNNPSNDAMGAAPAGGGEVDRDPDAEVLHWNNTMEEYAKMLYAANALRDRNATVTGKLRFDISPGSTIIVGTAEAGDITPGVDNLPQNIVGFVARVTVTINSQNASAATTFEMTHIRTEEEDASTEDGRISLQSHPFFADTFELAPLVESLDIA